MYEFGIASPVRAIRIWPGSLNTELARHTMARTNKGYLITPAPYPFLLAGTPDVGHPDARWRAGLWLSIDYGTAPGSVSTNIKMPRAACVRDHFPPLIRESKDL